MPNREFTGFADVPRLVARDGGYSGGAGVAEMSVEDRDYDIEVYFDGDCPLCAKEIAMLRRWDRQRRIRFTDIAAIDFSAGGPGRTFDQLMASMHGRLPDGTWIDGVEVFRRMYAAVGFRRLVALTRWPGIRWTLDQLYRVFAKYRLRLTGRCHQGGCRVPSASAE